MLIKDLKGKSNMSLKVKNLAAMLVWCKAVSLKRGSFNDI